MPNFTESIRWAGKKEHRAQSGNHSSENVVKEILSFHLVSIPTIQSLHLSNLFLKKKTPSRKESKILLGSPTEHPQKQNVFIYYFQINQLCGHFSSISFFPRQVSMKACLMTCSTFQVSETELHFQFFPHPTVWFQMNHGLSHFSPDKARGMDKMISKSPFLSISLYISL